jgi:hypothetical protein
MLATLTAPQTDLLGKIRQHLAQLDTTYGFTTRLASENGWKPEYASAVVEEYAKFLFIAREGGHPVSPPPIIDKAWHLHLVHTEDYWGNFCPNILKIQLHHSPATGTHDEAALFADWSGKTRDSYRKFFGEPPAMWLNYPTNRRPQSPLSKVAIVLASLGAVVTAGGIGAAAPGAIAIGGAMLVLGVFLLIASRTSAAASQKGTSSCGGSSCSTDSGSSDSGGHGGHSCGGHSCGGGGH